MTDTKQILGIAFSIAVLVALLQFTTNERVSNSPTTITFDEQQSQR